MAATMASMRQEMHGAFNAIVFQIRVLVTSMIFRDAEVCVNGSRML